MTNWDDLEAPQEGERWKANGKKSALSELQIQTLFRARARILCPAVRIVAIPNGTHIQSMAGRRKANLEGRSAGFPDIAAYWGNGNSPENMVPGMALIEFKAGGGGAVSENQVDWLNWLKAHGFNCTVSRDPDHAIEFLRWCQAPFVGNISA